MVNVYANRTFSRKKENQKICFGNNHQIMLVWHLAGKSVHPQPKGKQVSGCARDFFPVGAVVSGFS